VTFSQSSLRTAAEDVVLVLAFVVLALARPEGTVYVLLLAAIPLVLGLRIATLHFPTRVAVDEAHVSFSAYGRTHSFAWSAVERLCVRRFLVKDRVLVRIAPAPLLQGRYWLTSGISGFEALVAELERRSSAQR
jgi:hypothetical protein